MTHTSSMPAAEAGMSRRALLGTAAATGLVYAFSLPLSSKKAKAAGLSQTPIGAFVRIGTDESVAIVVGVSEMGQGVSSGIAQVLAEELMVDWTKVAVETGQASAVYANPFIRTQATFGSLSMRGYFAAMRKAGATVRETLKLAASQTLGVPVSSLTAANGIVSEAGGTKSASYGALAAAAALITPPTNAPLLGTGQYIGASMPRADIPAKVKGAAIFGIDVRLPNMVYAAVQNAPVFGATVMPGTAIAKPTGALAVVNLDTAVAVVAKDTYAAIRAANQLRVSWSIPAGNSNLSSASIAAQAQQLMTTGPVLTADTQGSAAAAIAGATKAYDQTFSFPYLAHACMEVLNCTALVTATNCTVWAPTQAPGSVVGTAASITGLPTSAIVVNTTYLGGGLGRKIEQDFISQAIKIAKTMPGTPVKLTWSREQDFTADQYRSMALVRVRSGVDGTGGISGWWTRLVSGSYAYQHGGNTGVDFISIAGATGLPYALPDRLVEYVRHTAPVPVGSWRSIGCSVNTFVTESTMDELAMMAGVDPLVFRQRLLAGNNRALAVLDAVAKMSSWATPPAAGHARGLAFCFTDNAYIAEVVDISQDSAGAMKVNAVYCAVDCGMAVNPDGVTAQIEGGIVHGMSAALWGQVPISGGKATVRNFNSYRTARMRDMPVISVEIINGAPSSLGGAGEISVPPIGPALANAWAALTAQRLRTLPLFPNATASGGGEGELTTQSSNTTSATSNESTTQTSTSTTTDRNTRSTSENTSRRGRDNEDEEDDD